MIYTSYYNNIKNLQLFDNNLEFISIAGKKPNWINIKEYKTLAPKYEWWKEWTDKFHNNPDSDKSVAWYMAKYYETVLDKLDPCKIYNELLNLTDRKDVVLLCYETPDKFCHRHIVSKWFRDNGINCGEHICPTMINNVFDMEMKNG